MTPHTRGITKLACIVVVAFFLSALGAFAATLSADQASAMSAKAPPSAAPLHRPITRLTPKGSRPSSTWTNRTRTKCSLP